MRSEVANISGRHTLIVSSSTDRRNNKSSRPVVPMVVMSTTVETVHDEIPEVRELNVVIWRSMHNC